MFFKARSPFRNDGSNTMIVGGTAARQGQFPYQLEILQFSSHLCGASLVQVSGIQVAITAAHCVDENYPELYTLVAGELDRNQLSGLEQSRKVSRVVIHPNFDYWVLKNDIAILFPTESFQLNDNAKLVALPQTFDEVSSGTNITVSGWGSLSSGGVSPNILQYVDIPVVSTAQCNASWSQESADWARIVDSQLCAGDGLNGIASPCHGDSGGPAVSENGFLAGIVSWGNGKIYMELLLWKYKICVSS